ncbi:MAG: fumarylacetoacetate hydrolase family protein, partial [Gaiellaceae bacterium]
MKLASLAGGRDGRLAVVSRDLGRAAPAAGIAQTLQGALDDWPRAEPALEALSRSLESGKAESIAFDAARALAPLPRAYH